MTDLPALALELCRIPSVTGEEKALAGHLEAVCRARFGSDVRRVGDSLVAGRLADSRPMLLLVGHLDTVPGREGDPPPRIEGDRLIGLGASDMKGGLAVMLGLAADLDLARFKENLVLVLYAREEGPYEENGLGPLLAATPELRRAALALCLEPTDLEVMAGCMGSLNARVTFRGKSAHSARPWQGENAVHKAAPLLAQLARLERREVTVQGLPFFEVASATQAKGGSARNVVPSTFELNLNWRFAPEKSLAQAEEELSLFVAGRAEVEIVDRSPAGRVCADNALVRRLVRTTGAPLSPKQAWTDVARLTGAGIDAVNFGPGLTGQAHQQGEHVPLANLTRAYQMLRDFLEGSSR